MPGARKKRNDASRRRCADWAFLPSADARGFAMRHEMSG